jgi:hypothetical protein
MKLCIFAACLMMLAGCKTEPARLHSQADPYLDRGHIQFEDHTTDMLVDVVGVDAQRMNGGLLKVIVTLRNKTSDNLFAEFRTTFLDAGHHVLEQTNWEPIELNARTASEYVCTSMSAKAADYQIIIRKPSKTSYNKR